MREKQHGSMWHSVAELGTALGGTVCFGGGLSCECVQCVPVPPGTQCGGKLPSITHACMCRATGKFHNPHAHVHACYRKLKT